MRFEPFFFRIPFVFSCNIIFSIIDVIVIIYISNHKHNKNCYIIIHYFFIYYLLLDHFANNFFHLKCFPNIFSQDFYFILATAIFGLGAFKF